MGNGKIHPKLAFVLILVALFPVSQASFTQEIELPSTGSHEETQKYVCLSKDYSVSLVFSGKSMETSSNGGKISATSSSPIYLTFIKGPCKDIGKKALEIESGVFQKLLFPSFGFPSPLGYKISLSLGYVGMDFLNSTRVKGGSRLLIRNSGDIGNKTALETGVP